MSTQPADQSRTPPQHEPTEKDLDKALEATFPASDPISLHGDTAPTEGADAAPPKPASRPARPGEAATGDQSLQQGADCTSESAGSGGTGRKTP